MVSKQQDTTPEQVEEIRPSDHRPLFGPVNLVWDSETRDFPA